MVIRNKKEWNAQEDSGRPLNYVQKCSFKQVTQFIFLNHPLDDVTHDTPLSACKRPEFFNHFHNSHFQVHRQGLNCSLYAQPLKQAQEIYQTYALKDSLGQPPVP